MTKKKNIGLLTIGQSPRPDMTADLNPIFEGKADYIEAGALDGLTKNQVESMKPEPGEHFLVTRLTDGTVVTVASRYLSDLMQKQVSRLEAEGVSALMILCTEAFQPFDCSIPVIYPNDVLKALVPMAAPAAVDNESTMNTFFKLGIFPSSSIIFARVVTPMTVPIQSNRSTNNNVKTMVAISVVKILFHSNFMKMGSMEGGMLKTPSRLVMPIGMPMMVVARIPIRSAPLMLRTNRMEVNPMPMIPNKPEPEVSLPKLTRVAGLSTITSAFFKPIKAM